MNFGMIILNQSINNMQNYATWIQIVLLFKLKPEHFHKDIAENIEKGLIH